MKKKLWKMLVIKLNKKGAIKGNIKDFYIPKMCQYMKTQEYHFPLM